MYSYTVCHCFPFEHNYTDTVSTNVTSNFMCNLRSQSPTNCLLVLRKMWHLFALIWKLTVTFGNTKQNSKFPSVTTIFEGRGVDIFDDHLELWRFVELAIYSAFAVTWVPHRSLLPVLVKFRSILLERRSSPKMLPNRKRRSKRPRTPAMFASFPGELRDFPCEKNRCTGPPLRVTERPSKWDILHRDGPTSPFKWIQLHPSWSQGDTPTASFMPRYMSVWRSSIVLLVLHVGQGLHQKKSSGPVMIWI